MASQPVGDPRYKGKYRIESNRLQGWDYSAPGVYFVTLCTHQKAPLFGHLEGVRIVLSPLGEIVRQCWKNIPDHYPGVRLDLFVVMPDHLHGLIQLSLVSQERGIKLGRVIASSHAAVTRQARQMGVARVWQRNYYDHIVRDHEDMIRIREYIINNPIRWAERE